MKKLLVPSILVFALVVALTACSPRGVTLNVTTTDAGFDAQTYTVPAGKEVTLNMKNNDIIEHEFAILKLGDQVSLPFGEDDESKIYWELDGVAAGTTKSGTFTAPTEPGKYAVVCGIPGHIEKGMTATLIVK